jgi:hypothetical protein
MPGLDPGIHLHKIRFVRWITGSSPVMTSRSGDLPVQPSRKKYSASPFAKISSISAAVPARQEGRIAIVTNVGRNAMDGSARQDEAC